MALGRRRDFERAEKVLTDLIDARGPSSLTYSFLGVVRKNRYLAAKEERKHYEASGALSKALDAFMNGFKLDPRVIFAGINVALLLEVSGLSVEDVLPVVRYFINDAISSRKSGFWEHAAKVGLSVLDDDKEAAMAALGLMLVDEHEPWMPFSTYANLQMIRESREKRCIRKSCYDDLVGALKDELDSAT